jgi:hypothetical protein
MKGTRRAIAIWGAVGLILTGAAAGWASSRDEATIVVGVGSADHEMVEGYFSLGDDVTVMAKPGSSLHRFLARHRGRTIRITLTEATVPTLSRLERDRED